MKAKVKAAEGRRVRREGDFLLLAPDGEQVELTTYYRRLIKAGDLVVVEDKPATRATAKTTAQE